MSVTRRKPGVMGPFIDDFEEWLLDLGCAPSTVRNTLKGVGQLGRWMSSEGLDASQLNSASVLEFVGAAWNTGYRRIPTVRSFGPLLDFLISTEVVAAVDVVTPAPFEALIIEYRRWMIHDRGLVAQTVLRFENLARRFLQERAAAAPGLVADLTGADVAAFLLAGTSRLSFGAVKGCVAELRLLLRFLYFTDGQAQRES